MDQTTFSLGYQVTPAKKVSKRKTGMRVIIHLSLITFNSTFSFLLELHHSFLLVSFSVSRLADIRLSN